MGHQSRHSENTSAVPAPFLSYPKIEQGLRHLFVSPQNVETCEFFTLSDGQKRVYTENDALTDYGSKMILDPEEVSYMNLFINGVLQSRRSYTIKEGKLVIHTEDIPCKGTPIILQMIIIR